MAIGPLHRIDPDPLELTGNSYPFKVTILILEPSRASAGVDGQIRSRLAIIRMRMAAFEGLLLLEVNWIGYNANRGRFPMSVQLEPKPPFDEFVRTCTPLLKIPELEAYMRQRVRAIVEELLNFQPDSDPAKTLKQFIQKDENFLGVLLALTNLSQEKFLRLLTAQRFAAQDFGPEWGADFVYRKIKRDDAFAEAIARLFLEGRNSKLLAEQVADFYLDQLSLPANWANVIRDENIIGNVVRKKLVGEYTDQKGEYVERRIRGLLNDLQARYGIPYTHGQVALVGKEIDHVIPSLDDAYVMVMVSYMETTSSAQTARANEQQAMYQKIVGENVRYAPSERVFVNIVDGAGWRAVLICENCMRAAITAST